MWAVAAVFRRLGRPDAFDRQLAHGLLAAGADLFVRAASLNAYLALATRQATLIGPGAGAVHQVVRSTWLFNALFLDCFAISAQSLVAYFAGTGDKSLARRIARVTCQWSTGTGAALGLAMVAAQPWVRRLYVPATAAALFAGPWRIAACTQLISGVTFATDGVHFGTGDFRYLRNTVVIAFCCGGAAVLLVDTSAPQALEWVWCSAALWTAVRALTGLVRIWPGVGRAPLAA